MYGRDRKGDALPSGRGLIEQTQTSICRPGRRVRRQQKNKEDEP